MGAAGYADDIILMAPSRTSMKIMLEKCEQYASDHNLVFSTDPDPKKSKTKCLFMTGSMKNVVYPVKLKLYNEDLPWVETATHLGHELHQMCDMDFDCKVKRARLIDTSTDIREVFSFAHPDQILSATNVYASHFYGAMLWDFTSEICSQVFRSWNTCIKLAWNVPRSTHNYLVDNFLGINHLSIKKQLLGRFVNFFKNLLLSNSSEVKVLANIVARDVRSVTAKNLLLIENEAGLDPWKANSSEVKEKIPNKDFWRLPLLCQYLYKKKDMETDLDDTKEIDSLIFSLCSS